MPKASASTYMKKDCPSKNKNQRMLLLFERLSRLDQKAHIEFSDHFSPKFYRMCIKKGLTKDEALDYSAQLIIEILNKRIKKYNPGKNSNFEAWVMTVAKNLLINFLSNQADFSPLLENIVYIPNESIEEENNDQTLIEIVCDAWKTLPPLSQEILRLKYYYDYENFKVIGEELNISEDTARVRHHRALKSMQILLSKNEYIIKKLKLKKEKLDEA